MNGETMPHTPEAKVRAIRRLRRIRGQAEALERAIEVGTECGPLLQQIVAMRGATNGLMAEVMESHLRETFDQSEHEERPEDREASSDDIDDVMKILRTYLR